MFLCLAYGAEKDWKALPKDEQDALLAQDEALRDRGALMAAVEPSVTTVTAWDGTPRVTTGAFARSNVPLAGFSLIEADSADHAAHLVADTPCARAKGAIEIRPVMMTNDVEWKNRQRAEQTNMTPRNTICLWFDKNAHEAARFYATTFPDSKVTAVHKAPGDYPNGKEGDVLTVEFTVLGIPCLGLNGGPEFRHSEAFSFQIATDNQEETDRYWNAIVGNGGKESQCGWCKDRWGLSWQITPRALTDALAAGGAEAKRAFEAMMPMKKIDVATIEAARRG